MTLSKTAGSLGGSDGLVVVVNQQNCAPLMIFTANNYEHNHTLCCTTSRVVSHHTLITFMLCAVWRSA